MVVCVPKNVTLVGYESAFAPLANKLAIPMPATKNIPNAFMILFYLIHQPNRLLNINLGIIPKKCKQMGGNRTKSLFTHNGSICQQRPYLAGANNEKTVQN